MIRQIWNWLFPKAPKLVIELSTHQKHQFIMLAVKARFKHDDRYQHMVDQVCLLSPEAVDYVHRQIKEYLYNVHTNCWPDLIEDAVRMGEKLPAWCKA